MTLRVPGLHRINGRLKKVLLGMGAALVVALVIIQLAYPSDKLLPFTTIDGQSFGGWKKSDAAKKLDERYATTRLELFFGASAQPYRTIKPGDIGTAVHNAERLRPAVYPWYLRIVPTSLFWARVVVKAPAPTYAHDIVKVRTFVTTEFGESCRIEPKNASLTFKNEALTLVPSENGGTCIQNEVETTLASARPAPSVSNKLRMPVTVIAPTVTNDAATSYAKVLTQRTAPGVPLTALGTTQTIAQKDILSWLTFTPAASTLDAVVDPAKATDYLTKLVAPKVTVAAGVSKVTTYDFIETSRVDGPSGQTLDLTATVATLTSYVKGTVSTAEAKLTAVAPRVDYTRTYSSTDAGLSALLQQYAQDHPGTFGVSMIELAGDRRRASYAADRVFTTASTYKLFVAYSALRRIEDGSWHWSDQIQGSRNLDTCFDDMIVKSDNACAEAMLSKIGFRAITSEIQALGLSHTTFLKGDSPQTTPGDLATFLAVLQSNQMLSQQSSRDRLTAAMKRNVYRQGIPAGTTAQVADKVGFLDALLHDAAIIYSPKGTYVLVIMTDHSSWATIADLTKKIEALRGA